MKNEIEEFSVHRELLARISTVNSVQDVRKELSEMPDTDKRFIDKIVNFEESHWENFLNTLNESDSELSVVARSAREALKSAVEAAESHEPFRLSSGIKGISASPYLGIGNGVPYIRLKFETADETIYSDQDLEDTLGIGTAVLEVVAESAHSMIQTLKIPPESISWGEEFEARLARAEVHVMTLRSLYSRHRQQEE